MIIYNITRNQMAYAAGFATATINLLDKGKTLDAAGFFFFSQFGITGTSSEADIRAVCKELIDQYTLQTITAKVIADEPLQTQNFSWRQLYIKPDQV